MLISRALTYLNRTNNNPSSNKVILTLRQLSLFIWEQHRVTGEFQIEVLNLIFRQTENRLGTLEVLFRHSPTVLLHLLHLNNYKVVNKRIYVSSKKYLL